MSDPLGKQLTELEPGERVTITVGDHQYTGQVIEKNRTMCELVSEFMESGGVSVDIALETKSIPRDEMTEAQLQITATEDVPMAWEQPTATLYDVKTDTSEKIADDVTVINDERETSN
jgi:hypothetical protein